MKKQLSAFILAAIFSAGILLSGCGASADKSSSQNSSSAPGAYEDSNMAMDDAAADTSEAAMMELSPEEADMAEGGGDVSLNGTSSDTVKSQKQKLIYTYHYSVETKDFDSFCQKINDKVTQIGGYVENSETNGSGSDSSNRYASLTLRIPADQTDQIISVLNSDSNITYQSRNSEDVTLRYVDMESHLKALRTEQDTLLQLMEKADKLKDVIAIQSQLTEVRYEIESYESQLRTYDNLVDYSTLYLNISEVERTTTITSSKTSFLEEIGNRFSDNVYTLGQWLRGTVISLIGSLPILAPILIIAAAIAIIIRKRMKRKNSHAKKQESNDQNIDVQK